MMVRLLYITNIFHLCLPFLFLQVYDATNGTRERREWLVDILSQQNGFKVMFVESVCTDADIVDGNIRVRFI